MIKKMVRLGLLSLFLFSFEAILRANDEHFASATIRFEQNVTDEDVEVVIEAKGLKEGLVKLSVISPKGQDIIKIESKDLGLRHFNFESPESKDIKSIKAAYPEGEYLFSGITSSGVKLSSKAALSHTLAEAAAILHPKADAKEVSVKDLEIAWTPVKNVAAYIVSVEEVDSENNFTARLPGAATKLSVPNGFLLSGKEYTIGIGTVTEKGNITYSETSFTTRNTK